MKKTSHGAKGSGSIRKRPDGRWEARYTVGVDPETGKQIRKSIYGKTQKEVRQRMAKTITEIDDGSYIEETGMKLSEWMDTWLEEYASHNVSPYTKDSYERIIRNHVNPGLGKVKLAELSALQIQKFYNGLMSKKKLSGKTVKNVHGVLHRALDKAVKLGMLRVNPADACDLPKTRRKEIHPMETEDISRFVQEIRANKYGYVYWVTLFTGMRQGEVLGLTWDCVDFERNTLFINKQLHKSEKVGGAYKLTPTKNQRSRVITVAPSVMEVLEKQKRRQQQMQALAQEAWNNEWNLVFTNEFGGHLCHFTVYKHYKKIVTKIGVPEERFHDLRHSYAVVSLESGDDIKTVQSNLGHATASFTLDVYGHVSQKMRQQSADRMEAFIKRAVS